MANKSILMSIWCLSILLAAMLTSAAAEEGQTSQIGSMLAMSLEELVDLEVVTATGVSMPVRLAPAVASVITAAQIKAIGATTLDEVLETVPGLHVSASHDTFLSSIWSIRGVQTSITPQTLLLINGIPFKSMIGARPYTFHMPVSMISRVEVVRGPGSAVYGADAFSGTVNVITKSGKEIDGTKTGIRYGSFDTSDFWFQHGGVYKGWDLYASIETQKSSGDNNRIVEEDFLNTFAGGALSAYSNTPAPLDTKYEWVTSHMGLKKNNFNLRVYGSMANNNGTGPGGAQTITYGGDFEGAQLLADLEYRDKKFAKDIDLAVRLYSAYIKTDALYEFFPPAIRNNPLPAPLNAFNYWLGNPITKQKYSGLQSTVIYTGLLEHKLRLALGWQFYDIDTDQFKNYGPAVAVQFGPLVNIKNTLYSYMEDQSRKVWNFSLQDEWEMARNWTLTAGVRYDHYNDFSSTTNPRAALVWETKYDLTTKLMYGKAFRAPDFGEQHIQNNSQALGNPDLQPETIDTYELVFEYQPTSTLLSKLNLFTYTIDGLIEYVPDPAPATTLTAQNYKDQEGHGFEVELHWEPNEKIMVLSSFAYQRSRDKDTKEIVTDAPEQQFYLNPQWSFMPDWSLNSQFYWIAGRHRADDDPRNDIKDYELVNLTLRRKNIANHVDMAVSLRNLFDEDIREPSPYAAAAGLAGAYIPNDYPMESRAIWGELRYTF